VEWTYIPGGLPLIPRESCTKVVLQEQHEGIDTKEEAALSAFVKEDSIYGIF
jgi:hypothetical protein